MRVVCEASSVNFRDNECNIIDVSQRKQEAKDYVLVEMI